MRAVSVHTLATDPYRAGVELGERLSSISPEVVFLFASIHLSTSQDLLLGLYDGLGKDAVVVGNSGDGVFSVEGVHEFGASALGLNSEGKVRWSIARAVGVGQDPVGTTRKVLANAEAILGGKKAALMMLLSDFSADASDIEKVIEQETDIPVVGGLAADDNQMGDCTVFANREILRDAVVLLIAEGELDFSIHIGNSIMPLGQPGTIEAAQGRTVERIDGLQAQRFIELQTGKQVLQSDRGMTTLTIIDPDQPAVKRLRSIVPMFAGQATGLGLYGGIEVGKRVQVCLAQPEALLQEVREIAEESAEQGPAVAAIVISCTGRKQMLDEEVRQEASILTEAHGPGLALTGFPSFGEIGPLRLPDGRYSRNLFHNMTYVLTLIR